MAPFPVWDPLAFAIEECHKRAIEIHAWMNPYRAVANTINLSSFAPSHIARTHPEWLLRNGTLRTLDPGIPEVRAYILKIVKDIAGRYDLDGIHFDDYFYPEGYINDEATFVKYKNGFTNKADWRRDNVNLLIKTIGREIIALKPWMKFGISPSGIYRNSTNPEIGSPTNGLEHYNTLFSDSKKWLQEGWIDYLIPQVYYSSRQSNAPYPIVVHWWQQHSYGRHIYIGIGSYKIGNGESAWNNSSEIPNQIRLNRTYKMICGESFYNTASIMSNRLGLKDSLKSLYNLIALPPEMPWKKMENPQTPLQLSAILSGEEVSLSWHTPAYTSELNKAAYYVLYRSDNPEININDPSSIVSVSSDTTFTDHTSKRFYYAVSSLNRMFNESKLSETITNANIKIPVTYVLNWMIEKDNEIKLLWKDNGLDSVKRFEIEKSKDGITFQTFKIIDVEKQNEEYVVNDIIQQSFFYRIKSLNNIGQSTFSKPVEIIIKSLGSVKRDLQKPVATIKTTIPEKSVTEQSTNVVKKDSIPIVPKPVLSLIYPISSDIKTGINLSIRINVVGNLVYRIYQENVQVTWGKIKTSRTNVTLSLPGTNVLTPGKYVLKIEMEDKKQELPFEMR